MQKYNYFSDCQRNIQKIVEFMPALLEMILSESVIILSSYLQIFYHVYGNLAAIGELDDTLIVDNPFHLT